MVEQLGAELVPGGAIELFLVRFFVVTTQHSKQGEATKSHEGFDDCTLIAQHLEEQAEVVGFFGGLLDVKPPAVFLED